MGELSHSREYLSFRASVPLKKICVEDAQHKEWAIYDIGPRAIDHPLICLPPVSGRADIYFKQMLSLSSVGYRVLSVEYPVVWNWKDFCDSFTKLLDHLNLGRVHLFGSSLGGFLAQKFAEYSMLSRRVQSLVLCNTFSDTMIFDQTMAAPTYWMLPALVLKSMVVSNFERGRHDLDKTDAVDFVVSSLESLSQRQLASRLTLNCRSAKVDTGLLAALPITVIDVNDDCAISQSVKDSMYKYYPNSRRAHLKSGGNFPYLSRADEVNLYLQIHLRQFRGTRLDEPSDSDAALHVNDGFEERARSSELSEL